MIMHVGVSAAKFTNSATRVADAVPYPKAGLRVAYVVSLNLPIMTRA